MVATWRLLGITLPLTAALVASLAWGVLGLLSSTAILLGAVIAPTDPVLASDIEAGAPLTELEEEQASSSEWGTIRFALTSEAGWNDGLAFPLTNLAIAAAGATATANQSWLIDWLLIDILYKISVGLVLGYIIGHLMARFMFRIIDTPGLTDVMTGADSLSTIFLAYAATEVIGDLDQLPTFIVHIP